MMEGSEKASREGDQRAKDREEITLLRSQLKEQENASEVESLRRQLKEQERQREVDSLWHQLKLGEEKEAEVERKTAEKEAEVLRLQLELSEQRAKFKYCSVKKMYHATQCAQE